MVSFAAKAKHYAPRSTELPQGRSSLPRSNAQSETCSGIMVNTGTPNSAV